MLENTTNPLLLHYRIAIKFTKAYQSTSIVIVSIKY